MNKNEAAAVLGETLLESAQVMPRGYTMKRGLTAGVGGALGALAVTAASAALGGSKPTSPAGHRGNMFMVLTPSRLVFFEGKGGLIRYSFGKVLVEAPRESVTSFVVGGGLFTSSVTIGFADGTTYALETPWKTRKHARAIRDQLSLTAGAVGQ